MTDLKRQYEFVQDELNVAVCRILASGQYIGGEEVRLFEHELATFLGLEAGGVATVGNGTDALAITYQAVGLRPGDEVIIPSFNYVSAAETAVSLGLVPIWAEIGGIGAGAQCFNISPSPEDLLPLLSPRTKALVGVNLYGIPMQAEALRAFCREHNLIFIEDNAQGMGGSIKTSEGWVPMGRIGDIATTSFYPTKPLGAMGDGGAIISDNEEWIGRARSIASHGQEGEKYHYKRVGTNSRLDALQAGILRVKLPHLKDWVSRQRTITYRYTQALSSKLILPQPDDNLLPTYHQYTVLLPEGGPNRELIRQGIISQGIASQLYYPTPLHQTIYATGGKGQQRTPLDRTENLSERMISLPIHPFLTEDEQDYIINHINTLLERIY